MNRAAPLLLLLAFSAPACADPVDDVVALLREGRAAPQGAAALMRRLAALPDFDLGQAEVRRVIEGAELPTQGLLGELLAPTRRLVKRGDRLEVHRSEDTRITTPKGAILALGKKVVVRLRPEGSRDAVIDKLEGVRVAKTAGSSLYDVKKLLFTREDGKAVVQLSAGPWPFTQTSSIPLDPPPPAPTPTAGLVGSIPGS